MVRQVAKPVRPSEVPSACATVRTSRQPNTHSTELRELRYPWHPWFGRAVTIYEVLVKQGHSVSRCGLEEERHRLSLEVPTWMFEPAACGRLRVMAVSAVNCDASIALQTLLRTTARSDPGDVLEAQHRSLPVAGGADAPVREPTEPVGCFKSICVEWRRFSSFSTEASCSCRSATSRFNAFCSSWSSGFVPMT